MKALRQIGLGILILLGLFAAYIGAYWFARKTDAGNEFFGSGGSPWRKWPAWMQHAEVKLFVPGRRMENWLGEYCEKRHLPGNGPPRVDVNDWSSTPI